MPCLQMDEWREVVNMQKFKQFKLRRTEYLLIMCATSTGYYTSGLPQLSKKGCL